MPALSFFGDNMRYLKREEWIKIEEYKKIIQKELIELGKHYDMIRIAEKENNNNFMLVFYGYDRIRRQRRIIKKVVFT